MLHPLIWMENHALSPEMAIQPHRRFMAMNSSGEGARVTGVQEPGTCDSERNVAR
jgi:hypothetical protein